MSTKESGKFFRRVLARESLYLCSLIIRTLPRKWLYGFADILSALAYRAAGKQRAIALDSLGMAFGLDLGAKEREVIARECFRNMARSGVELLYILERPELAGDIAIIEGRRNLDQALSLGKGVIAVSAHFGNFPLALTCLCRQGYRVNVILRRMRDDQVEEFLEKRRRKIGISFIHSMPRTACVDSSLKALRNNELLFIQLDQNFGTAGVFVNFFGREAATATGPVVLALRTGSPIVPLFIVRGKDNRHKIIIEEPLEIEKKDTQEETLRFNIQKITSVIEFYIRKYPQEWGWIHRRWKSRPS